MTATTPTPDPATAPAPASVPAAPPLAGRRPGLVLLHGAGDDGGCWAPFIRALGRPGLHVATPDAPAHGGRRAASGQTLAWDDLLSAAIEATEEVVRATRGSVVLGGHSMGASTALGVAAARPDLVAALFLEDPPMAGRMAEDVADPNVLRQDLTHLRDWLAGLQASPVQDVLDGARAEHPDWPQDEYLPWARAKLAADAAAFAEPIPFVGAGWAAQARRVRCRTLLVAGEPHLGSAVAPESTEDLAGLPGWTVVRLPVGHDVRRDARDDVVPLLGDLIDSVVM